MNRFNQFTKTIKEGILLLRSNRVPKLVKIVIITFFLIYWISPIDIFPDVIPILGILDELGLAYLIVAFLKKRYAPEKPTKTNQPVIDAEVID